MVNWHLHAFFKRLPRSNRNQRNNYSKHDRSVYHVWLYFQAIVYCGRIRNFVLRHFMVADCLSNTRRSLRCILGDASE